jgi:predicted RecB family nuclease
MPSTTPAFPLNEIGAKTIDAVSALAEANQRVVGKLIELSSSAAADRLRTLGELQSAAVEATREVFAPIAPWDAFEDFRNEPSAWYRKNAISALGSVQRMLKLIETNTQIVSRDAQRVQGSAERTAKEIQDAVSTCASRLRDLYATRG